MQGNGTRTERVPVRFNNSPRTGEQHEVNQQETNYSRDRGRGRDFDAGCRQQGIGSSDGGPEYRVPSFLTVDIARGSGSERCRGARRKYPIGARRGRLGLVLPRGARRIRQSHQRLRSTGAGIRHDRRGHGRAAAFLQRQSFHLRGSRGCRRWTGSDVQRTGVPRVSPEHRHGRRQPDCRAPHRAPGTAAIRGVGGWIADPVALDSSGHLRAGALRRQRQYAAHFHQHARVRDSSRPLRIQH